MKSATYTLPTGNDAGRVNDFSEWTAGKNLMSADGDSVTLFQTSNRSCCIYLLSVFFSVALITFDSVFLVFMLNEDTVHSTATGVSIENGVNGWAVAMASIMIGMDVLVLCTQAIDLYSFHFTVWPLTALTWFGQINGTGLSSALLGMVLHYPFANAAKRDTILTIAMLSLAAHAIFISAQFSVTLEYIMRKLEPKD